MTHAALIYPHQLFADHPAMAGVSQALMVEEPLLFTQYPFPSTEADPPPRHDEAVRRRPAKSGS